MALLPVLSLVGIADPAATVTVKDGTGNYDAVTNPGGFGAPNPTYAALAGVILKMASFSNLDSYSTNRLSVDDQAAIFSADGLVIGGASYSGLLTEGVFPDGVYEILHNLVYPEAEEISFTALTKQFTLTGASTIFASAVGFVIPAYSESKIFYIDRSKTLNGTGGYITEAFPEGITVPAVIEVVYQGDLKIAILKEGNRCLLRDIGVWTENGCKDLEFRDILNRYMQKIAIETKFTQGYVYDAHNMIINLASYCDLTTCGC
jgi:hypothetical protein